MTPDQILPYLVGPCAGLFISLVANWYQAKEKAAQVEVIANKDKDLQLLTREAISGITTLAGLNQANQRWQDQMTDTLEKIKEKLNHE